jgi:hypothetical protein
MKPVLWSNGEKSRPLAALRHEWRDAPAEPYVGFLTGSDESGNGFTIYIEDEPEFARVSGWVAVLSPDNARVFVKTIIRRPAFAFAGSGL